MSFILSMESLVGHPLSHEQRNQLVEYQRLFEIADDDPLAIVLAIMLSNKMAIEAIPNSFLQLTNDTIARNQQLLRDQSTLIARELILEISKNLLQQAQTIAPPQSWWTKWREGVILVSLVMNIVLLVKMLKPLFSH